jgi:hypothetical protein
MENAANSLELLENLKEKPGINVYGTKLYLYEVVSGTDGEDLVVI